MSSPDRSAFANDEKQPMKETIQTTFGQTSNAGPDGTKRGLKSRHAQMIALGGTIGTGLFVGSGQALRMGGPVFLLIAYLIITVLVFGIVTATTEMSSYLPVPGSSASYYGKRFVSPSLGFALGWMYWYIFAITVPAEIVVSNVVVNYWKPTFPGHDAVFITVFMVVIIGLNFFPVRVYGETEFWFASMKVFGIIGMLIMAVVLVLGGGPTHDRLGFRYWTEPGPINEYLSTGSTGHFLAFVGVICFSIYAFAFAPELLIVTGGEMENPRRNLPTAGKRYFYRLVIFYCLGAFAIGLIVPSNASDLFGGGSGAGASPWAIAAKLAGIKALDSVINTVILLSAWSAGNSYLYLASRGLYSLALAGDAPRIFTRCTSSGVPYIALAASSVISLLSYMTLSSGGATVFNWFVNLINTGAFQSWVSICFIYLRFRKATRVQNITDLPYRSRFQPYMSYVSGAAFFILMLAQGFKVFLNGMWNTSTFITSYVGIVIFLAFYLGHKFTHGRNDPWMIPSEEVDMVSGLEEIIANETPRVKAEKWHQKWRVLFE
ncbi:AAT family amino acid transporter [Aaosphaeria arxii CBS 175.79]|uniref:AAT family amino acid transporter n=1 Tax=Aaosphaeria arxii CBS 175.79 TaxID=1450172 RepID=A0A6A5XHU1_9PLEO|nr:AAT family amino acid transporter [Aaosphaeria arxii CBS 175.79]KAF2012808.1 AAT family amino acid transporter [Aaosphaeria arxii CBS 175.79]